MEEPASLGTFGLASADDLEEFGKPPIPFTIVAYERTVEYPDDVADAEIVDDDGDGIVTEDDLDRPYLVDRQAGGLADTAVDRYQTGPVVRHIPHEFTFHVYAEVEFGPLFRSLKAATAEGVIPVPIAIQFLSDSIVHDERAEFDRIVREYRIKASMIQELAQALAARYGMNRPTLPRSERRSGPRHHGRTTEGVRSAGGFT